MDEWVFWFIGILNVDILNPFPYLIFVISFTQAAFSNSKFYTRKLTKNNPKHWNMSVKSKIYAVFCVQSGKFYTLENIFTRAPPMVPVTIIRYGPYTSTSGKHWLCSSNDVNWHTADVCRKEKCHHIDCTNKTKLKFWFRELCCKHSQLKNHA